MVAFEIDTRKELFTCSNCDVHEKSPHTMSYMPCSLAAGCTLGEARCVLHSSPSPRCIVPANTTGAVGSRFLGYPRWKPDMATAQSSVVAVRHAADQAVTSSGGRCTPLDGMALLLPAPPTHPFHFLCEWAFHLFSQLAEHAEEPVTALLLPPPKIHGRRRPNVLGGSEQRIFDALLQRFAAIRRIGDGGDDSGRRGQAREGHLCLKRLRVGLAPAVSLGVSCCRKMQQCASTLEETHALVKSTVPMPAELQAARRVTDCALTRARLLAFRSFVRQALGVPSPVPAAAAAAAVDLASHAQRQLSISNGRGGSSSMSRLRADGRHAGSGVTSVLVVQRACASACSGGARRIAALPAFVSGLRAELSASLGDPVHVRVADFSADWRANAALMNGVSALVSVHGAALTNVLLSPPGLRAVVQLLPRCFPADALSPHAFDVAADFLTMIPVADGSGGGSASATTTSRVRGGALSLCCPCVQPWMGKASDVVCNSTPVARALSRLLLPRRHANLGP